MIRLLLCLTIVSISCLFSIVLGILSAGMGLATHACRKIVKSLREFGL